MFSLSLSHYHYHYSEIKHVPELLEMVDNIDREDFLMFFEPGRFAELCMQHNCPKTFLEVAPHAGFKFETIAALMKRNAVEIVQYMQENRIEKNGRQEAVRQVAESGNRTHIQFVLDHTNTPDIHQCIVEGACRGDHRSLVEEFLPKTLDPSVHSTAFKIAVQNNAVECLWYLLNGVSSDGWADALNDAVYYQGSLFEHNNKYSNIVSWLLDHTPEHVNKDLRFWANLTAVSLKLDDPHRIFEFVFDNTTLDTLLNCSESQWYNENQRQRLIDIHQHLVLSAATASFGESSKRKVM